MGTLVCRCCCILARTVAPHQIKYHSMISIIGKTERILSVGSLFLIFVDEPDRPVHRKQLLWFQQGWVMSTGIVQLWNTMSFAFGGVSACLASPCPASERGISPSAANRLQTYDKTLSVNFSGGIKTPWLCVWVKLRQLAQETPHAFPPLLSQGAPFTASHLIDLITDLLCLGSFEFTCCL